jgi:hypothetical protein
MLCAAMLRRTGDVLSFSLHQRFIVRAASFDSEIRDSVLDAVSENVLTTAKKKNKNFKSGRFLQRPGLQFVVHTWRLGHLVLLESGAGTTGS